MRKRGPCRVASLMVALALILALAPAGGAYAATVDDAFPGVEFETSVVTGDLTRTFDERDVFSLHLEAGEAVELQLLGVGANVLSLSVFEPGATNAVVGVPAATWATDGSGRVSGAYTAAASGLHFVRVALVGGSTAEYSLSRTLFTGEPDDLMPGVALDGSVESVVSPPRDTHDRYAVELVAGERFSAKIVVQGAAIENAWLRLFAPGVAGPGQGAALVVAYQQSEPGVLYLSFVPTVSGTYHLVAGGDGTSELAYTLETASYPISPDDAAPGLAVEGTPILGRFDGAGDVDYHAIQLVQGQLFSAFSNDMGWTRGDLYLVGPDRGDGRLFSAGLSFASESASQITCSVTETGRYYLQVRSRGASSDYSVHWSAVAPSGDGEIPGNAVISSPVADSVSFPGDPVDVHSIALARGERVAVTLATATGTDGFRGRLQMLGADATSVASATTSWDYSDVWSNTTATSYMTASSAGLHYAVVSAQYGECDYQLSVEKIPFSADNQIPGISVTSPYSGSLSYPEDVDDVLAIPLTKGKRVSIRLAREPGGWFESLRLYSPSSSSIASPPIVQSWFDGEASCIDYTPAETGIHYARVSGWTGAYTVSWSAADSEDDEIPGVVLGSNPQIGFLDATTNPDDVFRVHLDAGQRVWWETHGSDQGVTVRAFEPSATSVSQSPSLNVSGDGATGSVVATVTGDHYLAVSGVGTYTLEWGIGESEPDDELPGVPLPTSPVSGELTGTDYLDVYSVEISAGDRIVARVESSTVDSPLVRVVGPGASSFGALSSVAGTSSATYTATESGRHWVCVERSSAPSTYRLAWGIATTQDDDVVPGVALSATRVSDSVGPVTDPMDVRYIDLVPGDSFVATVTASDPDSNLRLSCQQQRVAGGQLRLLAATTSLPDGSQIPIRFTAPVATRLLLSVVAVGDDATEYDLEWALDEAPSSTADDDVPGIPLSQGATVGHLERTLLTNTRIPLRDVYSVALQKGETLKLDCSTQATVTASIVAPGARTVPDVRLASGRAIAYTAPESGVYYVVVQSLFSTQSMYRLTALIEPPMALPDVPGVPVASATVTGTANMLQPDSADILGIDLRAGDVLVGTLSSQGSLRLDAAIYDPETTSVYDTQPLRIWPGATGVSRLVYPANSTGTHYLRLQPGMGAGDWSLAWSVWQGEADDALPGVELGLPTTTASVDAEYDEDDLYYVELAAGMGLNVSLAQPSGADLRVSLIGPDIQSLDATPPIGSTAPGASPRTGSWTVTEPGTYVVRVRAASGGGDYTLTSALVPAPVPPAAPEVTGVRPFAGERVGPMNKLLQAQVANGAPPLNVRFEVSDGASPWTSLGVARQHGSSYGGVGTWLLDTWDTDAPQEGEIMVRTVVSDALGRSAASTVTAYVLDRTPPPAPAAPAVAADMSEVQVSWMRVTAADLLGYRLMRRAAGGSWTMLAETTGTQWTDRTAKPGVSYEYAVRSVDTVRNESASSPAVAANLVPDVEAPISNAGDDQVAYVGQRLAFDGTGSLDNLGIAAYEWTYGDGASGTGAVSMHAFEEPGTYVARLVARDAAGNWSSDEATVSVKELDESAAGTVTVTVRRSGGPALVGASVAVEGANGTKVLGVTGADGSVSFKVDPGAWKVYGYGDGYLPGTVALTVGPTETADVRLNLVRGETLVGEVVTKRMTVPEMVAANIDVTDPVNQWTTSYSIEWGGHRLTGFVNGLSGFGSGSISVPAESATTTSSARPPSKVKWETEVIDGIPRYAGVMVTGEVGWLKEVFDCTLTLVNTASDARFEMSGTSATIELPSALALAPKASGPQQTARVDLGSIPAGGRKSVSWQVRGDQQGEWWYGVNVETTLRPFEDKIERTFKPNEPVKVYGKDSVTTRLSYPKRVWANKPFVVRTTMRNMTPFDVYLVKTRLTSIVGCEPLDAAPVGSWVETPSIPPDGTWSVDWLFLAKYDGVLSLVENEGDISGWVRQSAITGDEHVVPFIPKDAAHDASIEESGTLLRYYRIVDPEPVDGQRRGVWFLDATATVDVSIDGDTESRETTVVVNNEYPSGVFALPVTGFRHVGDDFQVDITALEADGFSLETTECVPFKGKVRARRGAERTMKLGSEQTLQGGIVLEAMIGHEYEGKYTVREDGSVKTAAEYAESLGAGVSVAPFNVGFKTPVVSGKLGASVKASSGYSLLHGSSSEFSDPLNDGPQALALTYIATDLNTLSSLARDPGAVLEPALVAYKARLLGREPNFGAYRHSNMAGAGSWGKSSANAGVSMSLGGPEINGHALAGASVNLLDYKGEYSTRYQLISYPTLGEYGITYIDRNSSTTSVLQLKTYMGTFEEDIAALRESIEGDLKIEAIFDDEVMAAVFRGTRDLEPYMKRVVVTVEDRDNNVTQEFTVGRAGLDRYKTMRKNGTMSRSDGVMDALKNSLRLDISGGGGFGTGPTLGDASADLLELSTSAVQYGGPKPDKYSHSWEFALKGAYIGGEFEYEDSFEYSARNTQATGVVRDGLFYPLASYSDEPKTPSGDEMRGHIRKVVDAAHEYVDEPFARVREWVGGVAISIIDSVVPQQAPGMRISALAATHEDRMTFEVAAGSTPEAVEVTLSVLPARMAADGADGGQRPSSGGLTLMSDVRQFYPAVVLATPATVTASWAGSDASGVPTSAVALWEFDQRLSRWTLMPTQHSSSAGTMTAPSSRLGLVAVGADLTGPLIEIVSPSADGIIDTSQPWLMMSCADPVSGLDTPTVSVSIDGQQVPVSVDTTGEAVLQLPPLVDGDHTLEVMASDRLGNSSTQSRSFRVDTAKPDAPISLGATMTSEWAELEWGPASSPGISYRVYRRLSTEADFRRVADTTATAFSDWLPSGGTETVYAVRTVDSAGNESDSSNEATIVARYATAVQLSVTPLAEGMLAVESTLTAADGLSLENASYLIEQSADGESWVPMASVTQESTGTLTLLPEPEVTTMYRARFGGTAAWLPASAQHVFVVERDITAPTTTLRGVPSEWTSQTVTASFDSSEVGDGCRTFFVRGSGAPLPYESPLVFVNEGVTELRYWSVDAAGNRESDRVAQVRIDKTAPQLTADQSIGATGTVTVSATAVESLSGLHSVRYSLNGGTWCAGSVATVSLAGTHVVRFEALDNARNRSQIEVVVYVAPAPTALAITVPASAPSYAAAVNLTAELTSRGSAVEYHEIAFERWTGSAWTAFSRVRTDAQGKAVASTPAIKERQLYRARFAEQPGLEGCVSPTSAIKPKVRLTRSTSWSTLSVSKVYTAKGFVEPKHTSRESGKITVRAYKQTRTGSYKYVRSFTASISAYSSTKSRYSAKVKLTSKGKWKLVAYHYADTRNAATYGTADYVKVR